MIPRSRENRIEWDRQKKIFIEKIGILIFSLLKYHPIISAFLNLSNVLFYCFVILISFELRELQSKFESVETVTTKTSFR